MTDEEIKRLQEFVEQEKRRKEAARAAQRRYQQTHADKVSAYVKENYKSISANFKKPEGDALAATLKAHGLTAADVIRATAYALTTSSDTTKTADEIRTAAQKWRESQSQSDAQSQNADEADGSEPGGDRLKARDGNADRETEPGTLKPGTTETPGTLATGETGRAPETWTPRGPDA